MTIPVSSVVNVNVVLSPAAPARANFSILMGITNETTGPLNSIQRTKSYSSLDGVTADWPADSELLAIATTYYSQSPRPTNFKAGLRLESAEEALLLGGGTIGGLAGFQAISDGSFNITIDGDSQDILLLDFSSITTIADVATVVQAGLQAIATGGFTAATCTLTSENRFLIASGTTGVSSTISEFLSAAASGTNLVSSLDMTQGRTQWRQGQDAETITASLNAIEDADPAWYGFLFTKEVRDAIQIQGEDAVKAAGAWTEARTKIFGNISNDANVLISGIDTDIISELTALGYNRSFSNYAALGNADQYSMASCFGRAFTIDFGALDSTFTLKFKQLPGILTENLSGSQYSTLQTKRGNAYIDVGGNNMFAESYMHGTVFFDDIFNIDWLTNAIQTNVFGRLYQDPNKVPLTDKGGATLEQQVISALDEARNNGMIAPGNDIDGVFLSKGYITTVQPVADIPAGDKSNRVGPTIGALALLAGAIHTIQVNLTLER